jgi:hypothetical protein
MCIKCVFRSDLTSKISSAGPGQKIFRTRTRSKINFSDPDPMGSTEETHERRCRESSGECNLYSTNRSMYPLRNFDAIYTSGLCVFRRDADHGYEFMDEPLYDVCAIAIAAPQNPRVENEHLPSNIADIMLKKVATIFAIAQDNKHDALVLSAFGCGAFHNPPKHVANIFKSVIKKYAGVFRHIDFAITGSPSNPKGNYAIFKKVLDGLILETPTRVESGSKDRGMQKEQIIAAYQTTNSVHLWNRLSSTILGKKLDAT